MILILVVLVISTYFDFDRYLIYSFSPDFDPESQPILTGLNRFELRFNDLDLRDLN